MLETLDESAVRRWSVLALETLERHRAELDASNVYPVADGDTGTNLAHTLRSAAESLAELTELPGPDDAAGGPNDAAGGGNGGADRGAGGGDGDGPNGGVGGGDGGGVAGGDGPAGTARALRAMARGAVLGARGNSGVILSQVLRGLADGLEEGVDEARAGHGDGRCDGPRFGSALRRAAERAYAAVADPVEGTMLSVVRAAAEASHQLLARAVLTLSAPPGAQSLSAVVAEAVRAAAAAVQRTPEQLPALARAGVVDAGARGLYLLLDALSAVVEGVAVPAPPWRPGPRPLVAERETGSARYGYEVQYLLQATDAAVAELRTRLRPLGDSLAVAGTGAGEWSVHVHVDDVGAAIEAGVELGRPRRIRVTRFADQPPAEPEPRAVDVLALAAGPGLAALFEAEGAHVLTALDPAVGPGPLSVERVLDSLRALGPAPVVVLPDSVITTQVVAAAAARARDEGIRAAVVPTASAVQGLAALAVHDPQRRFEDDVIAMAEAAAATRWAEIVRATERALTSAGPCRPGDVLGLIDGDVVVIGDSVPGVAAAVVDRLLGVGGELVTVVLGDGAPAAAEQAVRDRVEARQGLFDLVVYSGGSPDVPVLIGLE